MYASQQYQQQILPSNNKRRINEKQRRTLRKEVHDVPNAETLNTDYFVEEGKVKTEYAEEANVRVLLSAK